MTHDEYWLDVWNKAHDRLAAMFADSAAKIEDLTGDEKGIDSTHDAKEILSYVFRHCPTADEKACAIVSVNEALHAWHEVNEHAMESAKAGASVR